MIRYDIDIDTMSDGYHASEPVLERIISPDGEWVRATHALAIEAERNELREERTALRREIAALKRALAAQGGNDAAENTTNAD